MLEIGRECIERGVHLHVAKNGIVFDDSMQSKIVAKVLGLVTEIERDFISSRTKEALAKRRSEGMKLWLDTGRRDGLPATFGSFKHFVASLSARWSDAFNIDLFSVNICTSNPQRTQ